MVFRFFSNTRIAFNIALSVIILFSGMISTGVYAEESELSSKAIHLVLNNTTNVIEENYLDAELSGALTQALKEKMLHGSLPKDISSFQLAKYLDKLLREYSGDNYFSVTVTEPISLSSTLKNVELTSVTIESSKMLTTQLGYLSIAKFSSGLEAEQELIQVMNRFKDAQALILDLRRAEGDSLVYAQQLLSYFFASDTLLSDVITRHGKIEMMSRDSESPMLAIQPFPLYVLLSGFSTSSAEFIGYTLQEFDKAVVLGDNTIGSARFVKSFNVGNGIQLSLPVAKTIHPKTKHNWQNNGVTPDIQCKNDECIPVVEKMVKSFFN